MRRWFSVIVAFSVEAGSVGHAAEAPLPVIYDTDIGADIDDTWALGFILASPELDLKLVVSDSHNALSKAAIIAKFLNRAGRGHIPVGIGIQCDDRADAQDPWARGYDLSRYPGNVHRDGVQAIIDVIMRHPEPPVTLLAVGPVPNIAEALKREPRIAERARLVVMGGTFRKNDGGGAEPEGRGDYNVAEYAGAARIAYTAAWDLTLAPMNTAARIQLTGEDYRRVREADNPLARAIIENYEEWARFATRFGEKYDTDRFSSTLFDTLAVYLAWDEAACNMEDIRFRITDRGHTLADPKGKLGHVALTWKDQAAFHKLLAERIARYRP